MKFPYFWIPVGGDEDSFISMNVIAKPLLQGGGLLLRGGLHRHIPTTALLASNLFNGYKKQNQIPLLNPTINNNHQYGYSSNTSTSAFNVKPWLYGLGLAGCQLLLDHTDNNVAYCMDNDRPSKRVKSDSAQTQALTVDDGNNFFNKFTVPGTLPPPGNHRSSPKNTLSADSLKLPAGRKLYEKGKDYDFCPITTFSSDPANRVTCLVISTFPPDDDCQGIAEHGPFYTRVLTNVKDGKEVYTSFDSIQQNPAIHAFSRTTHQVVQDKCKILRETAKFVCDESIAWVDRSPFPAPFNQGDPKQKDKFAHYKKMKKDFDPLVAEYIKEIIESNSLLPRLKCVVLLGDVWEFATVQYPNMIDPSLIIQHCPVIHPTVIDHFYPTPRQGYTYYECMSNVTDLLRTGTTDFRDILVPWDNVLDMFPFGKTKNDGKEGTTSGTTGGGGSDHFVYVGRYDGYTGGDNTVFVGYNCTHFRQLMHGADGEGIDHNATLNQKELKEGSHKLENGLTLEIIHFMDYYESRDKQMERDDWGVQNREGAYKAWKKYVNDKREGEDEETEEELQGGLDAILAASKE